MNGVCRVCMVFAILLFILVMLIRAEVSNTDTSINKTSEPEVSSPNIENPDQKEGVTNENSETSDTAPESNDDTLELLAANAALSRRIDILENRLRDMEQLLFSVHRDVQFHHPTVEFQYVDMQVVQWEEAVRNELRNVAISFQSGFTIGAPSSWEFSLGKENDAVTVNLLLIEEGYNRGALFAGFSAYVLDKSANALPVNFLDGTGRTLHLPNVVTLNDIRNSTDGLSEGDVFRIRCRLELFGVGHKLYPETFIPAEYPAKDVQTVIFDVEDVISKIENNRNTFENASLPTDHDKPLAYTRFALKHDSWNTETNWAAELHWNDIDKSLAFHVILEHSEWSRLHASFIVEVWDVHNKNLIQTEGTPINNFVKDRITIDPLIILSQLPVDEEDLALQFKIQFVVYGRNARYYTDVM